MDRTEALRLMGEDIIEAVRLEAADIGAELTANLSEAALYAAARADHLSLAVGEPGFELALAAERDNVALYVAGGAVAAADAVDARILAAIRGGISLAARAGAILATV